MTQERKSFSPPERPAPKKSRLLGLPIIRTIAQKLHLGRQPSTPSPSEGQSNVQTDPTSSSVAPEGIRWPSGEGPYKSRPRPTDETYSIAATYTPLVDQDHISSNEAGLYNTAGKQLLVTPNSELITRLHQADERISYFPPQPSTSHKDESLRPDADGKLPLRGSIGEYEFFELVTNPLTHQLFTELKAQLGHELGKSPEQMNVIPFRELSRLVNERFAFRGIACSVNGPIIDEANGMLVKDIRQILADGGEKIEEGANVGGMYIDPQNGQPELLHHVNKGFIHGPMKMQFEYPQEIGRIFPALLVYDRRKLTHVPNTPYAHTLPETPEERSKVIEKVFILPRRA